MLVDSFIERNAIVLKNLNTNASHNKDVWVSGTGYGFYSVPYEDYLSLNRYYYLRCSFKFTTTKTSDLPTWFTFYFQGGGGAGGPGVSNIAKDTEYLVSGIRQPNITNTSAPISSGTLYCGDSGKTGSCTFYAKNVLVYDVTNLYMALRAKNNISTTDQLKAWCDTNLDYVKKYTDYDVTDLVSDNNENKVCISGGNLLATEMIEADGMEYYTNSYNNYILRGKCYFDSSSGISIYNNAGGGTVTHSRVDGGEQGSPFYPEHKYVLKITTNGTASPGAGGFLATHIAAANKIFIERFVAKVPVGYNVVAAYNPQGTGSVVSYLTSMAGTGKWEEYAILYKCGSSGSFSSGGHVYLSGSPANSVTWYLAYVNNCDITNYENLKYYSVLPSRERFKLGRLYTQKLDERNLIPNGDCSDLTTSMLPSGWEYDTEDVAGNGKASIVQPVNAGSGSYGVKVRINPNARYKLSYWIKCKGDMTSFLTAIYYYTENDASFNHSNTVFLNGTKTTLSAELKNGDTQMTVASNANWRSYSYSMVGFRSGSTWSTATYNNLGTSNGFSGSTGLIKGVSGSNVVTFNAPYSGTNKPSGTVVVESIDGGNYPYPVGKGNLPTDNTWKYVEGYFGADNTIWEGATASGGWQGIPQQARKLTLVLNLYKNTGTVPIKYCDIRLEEVGKNSGHRHENKIQIKKEMN